MLGCAAPTPPATSRPEQPAIRNERPRTKGKAPQAHPEPTATGKTRPSSVTNGLPDALSPLPMLKVRHLAFANDGAQRTSANAHAAGAVEDERGLTVCLLWGPLSLPDGSIILHPSPFAASAQARCFREEGVRIATAARAVIAIVAGDISFVLALETPSGSQRRAYSFGREARVRQASLTISARKSRETVGQPPPWPRTLEQELKQTNSATRGLPRVSLQNATKVSDLKRVSSPDWLRLLERDSELETRTLVHDERLVLALTLSRASSADSEPAHELALVRDGDRWLASPIMPEVIAQAAHAPSLGEGALLVLTRAQNNGVNGSRRTLYADRAQLRVFVPLRGQLAERGKLTLGEVGYTRLTAQNRVWRVFYQARVTSPGCLRVRRDHAWTALFDTRTAVLSERSRLTLGLDGLPSDLISRFARTEGKYAWNGEQLIPGACH